MSVFSIFRPRRAPSGRRPRALRPVLDGLETRQLLSLNLMSGAGDYPTQYDPPRTSQFLGQVASDSFDDTNDPLSATVDWGDGTAQTFTANAGMVLYPSYPNSIYVPGHSFQKNGDLTIHVKVRDMHGASIAWDDHFTVADAGYVITQGELTPVGVASNVVGAKAPFFNTIVKPGDPTGTATIKILSCTYTAYDHNGNLTGAFTTLPANGVVVDATGYHVTHTSRIQASIVGTNSCYAQNDYWSAVPGTYTILTDITWSDDRGVHYANPVKSQETITRPTAVMTPTMNNTGLQVVQDPKSPGDYDLKTNGFDGSKDAIDLKVTIDPTQHGAADGMFGVVQTMVRNLKHWTTDTQDGSQFMGLDYYVPRKPYPSKLLDNTRASEWNGQFTPYYGTLWWETGQPTQVTWKTGETLEINDSPTAPFNAAQGGEFALSDDATWTDTVMFTPSGGIPVPITSMQWGYSADVVTGNNGIPALNQWFTNPEVFANPTPTYVYPTWVDLAGNYEGENYTTTWFGQATTTWKNPPVSNPV